jgi:hypothetical protein
VFCESGGAGLAEGEGGVTLIELTLDALFAAAHSKNAARVMHSSGALGALERLFDYSTEAVIARVLRLLARLAAHCEGVASELESSASTVALTALVRSHASSPDTPSSCVDRSLGFVYTSQRSSRSSHGACGSVSRVEARCCVGLRANTVIRRSSCSDASGPLGAVSSQSTSVDVSTAH